MKVTQLISALTVGFGLMLGGCGDDGARSLSDQALASGYCDLEYGCFPEDWDSHAECAFEERSALTDADAFGDRCYSAAREFFECLYSLDTCSELLDYWEEFSSPYPCQHEEELYFSRC